MKVFQHCLFLVLVLLLRNGACACEVGADITCSGNGVCGKDGVCNCTTDETRFYGGPDCADCKTGYFGKDCTQSCDLCAAGATCDQGMAGVGCVCQHSGQDPSNNCKSCLKNHWGPTCEVCPCWGHGTCDETTGLCVCSGNWAGENCNDCKPNMYGATCSRSCNTCSEGGCCSDGIMGNGKCTCKENFTGFGCFDCKADQECPAIQQPSTVQQRCTGTTVNGRCCPNNGPVYISGSSCTCSNGQNCASSWPKTVYPPNGPACARDYTLFPTAEPTRAPTPCAVTWSVWDVCSDLCGGGTQSRTATVLYPECQPDPESRSCNEEACIEGDCQGSWLPYGACNATCGGGVKSRSFNISVAPTENGTACPDTFSTACNEQPCPTPSPTTSPTSPTSPTEIYTFPTMPATGRAGVRAEFSLWLLLLVLVSTAATSASFSL